MEENILERVKESISEISKKNEAYHRLIELKENVTQTLDEQINKFLEDREIVKRIKFP